MTTVLVKDSIERAPNLSLSNNLERKGGRLYKGPASARGTVPTIPTRFITIITDNNDKKGFQRTSKRFQYNYTDTPGPGSYVGVVSLDDALKKTSDSKKGYGNFASSTGRDEKKLNPDYTPGAGTYETENAAIFKKKDFSQGNSSVFQKPIALKVEKEIKAPAPNEYDVSKSNKIQFRTNNVCADSAFKSQTKREFLPLDKIKDLPAPGSYDISEDLAKEASKAPVSSFKSSIQRHTFTPTNNLPGPSDYRPFEPINENVNRQLFPRRHYLAISAPAIPLPPDLPLPGPGTYEVRDFKEPEKKYMSSAAFVSSTGRWLNNSTLNPGPANYTPGKATKQSFHYNFEKKWI